MDDITLILTHDEAVELAAVLGELCEPESLYGVFDRLTDMFPGDIEYPPYQEALKSYQSLSGRLSQSKGVNVIVRCSLL